MRALVVCAALPGVASLVTLHPSFARSYCCFTRSSPSCRTQTNTSRATPPARGLTHDRRRRYGASVYGDGHPRGLRTRRASISGGGGQGSANMDASEDDSDVGDGDEAKSVDDGEMYASLRARLVELEKKAALEQREERQQASEETSSRSSRGRDFMMPGDQKNGNNKGRSKQAKMPLSPEERRRNVALLTIQSVGVISVALSFGTAMLYWLAGDYFVHFGPRSYPGKASSSTTLQMEQSTGTGGETGTPPARRSLGGSATREAFRFEGFPDAANTAGDPGI